MTVDRHSTAALALHRFGLGPRPGTIAAIASDPRGAMLGEIERAGAGRLVNSGLLNSAAAASQAYENAVKRRKIRFARKDSSSKQPADADAQSMSTSRSPKMDEAAEPNRMSRRDARSADQFEPKLSNELYLAETGARTAVALAAEIGFAERLVWFWSNHFCIAAKSNRLRVVAGPLEREAIRPHILGRFTDMLLAVESHPAMLTYLDNVRSIGPNSRAGTSRGRGLNENLAREILELHTLGVRTVYTQADVTSFAKALTGWSVVSPQVDSTHAGEFEFNANKHEPGSQVILGKNYPDSGIEQGRAILRDLAKHRATARHIASKLVTHFIADIPPEPLVARVAKRFSETDGNLKEVSKALLLSEEAWTAPRTKIKRPSEWLVSAMRAVDIGHGNIRAVIKAQAKLGEPLWQPPSPKGFSDQKAEWVDGIAERFDVVSEIVQQAPSVRDPSDVLEQTLGPLASEQTRSAVARAGDREQALTLLLMAPEFQLR